MAAAKLFRKTDGDNVEKYNARKVQLEKYIQTREHETRTENKRKVDAEQKKAQMLISKEKARLEEENRIKDEERKKLKTYNTNYDFVKTKLAELKLDDKMSKNVKFLEVEDLVQMDKDPCDKDFQETIVDKQLTGVRSERIDMKVALIKREEEKDHIERAFRQVESEERMKSADKRQSDMMARVNKDYEFHKNASQQRHIAELEAKHKFAYMQPSIDSFTWRLMNFRFLKI